MTLPAHAHLQRLLAFLKKYWRALLTLFFSLLLPLLGFVKIAEEVYEKEPFAFEEPLMLAVHAGASTALNNVTRFLSLFGNMAGMVPLTGLLSVMLYRIRPRLAYFLLLALGGTVAINTVLKQFFDRPRPAFWTPFLPEPDFSFPSGHAMFASALVSAVVVILWSTRWRLPALVCGALYVLAMMWSWVYIGVHYPTDVTAGALVSVAWVVGLNYVLHVHRILRPAPAASAERPGEERGRQETSSAQ